MHDLKLLLWENMMTFNWFEFHRRARSVGSEGDIGTILTG